MFVGCPSESDLEKLLLGQDLIPGIDLLEEHVLLCPRCGQWLESELQFTNAMRHAIEIEELVGSFDRQRNSI